MKAKPRQTKHKTRTKGKAKHTKEKGKSKAAGRSPQRGAGR